MNQADQSLKNQRLATAIRYGSAMFSQGLISGFHFVLNLLLVRMLTVADFGIYALTFVIAILSSSVGNALVSTPLCVYAPGCKGDERIKIESMLTTLMSFLLGAALVAGTLISLALSSHGSDFQVMIAATTFVVSYLARQYSRSFGYSRFDVTSVLWGDMCYVTVGAVLLLLQNWYSAEISSVDVLTVLTIANAVAVLLEVGRLPTAIILVSIGTAIKQYEPIWKQARWALIGALTTVVVSQAHSLVVSALKSPAAYAPLAAGFVIFGPVRVIFTTIQNVIKPEMALAIANGQPAAAQRQMVLSSLISVGAVSLLVAICFVAWPWIDAYLYSERYADAPMKSIVFFWAAVTLVSAMQNGPFAALQSLKAFKALAMTTVFGSIFSLLAVAILLSIAPIHWSLAGILMAELMVAIWVAKLAMDQFSQDKVLANNPVNA